MIKAKQKSLRRKAAVTTVTLTWNAENDIRETLRCIKKQIYKPKEVIVVDNGSKDRTVEIIKNEFPFARIIRLDKNYGICAGYNKAFSTVPQNIDYVVVIDQDVMFDKNYIKKVVERFEKEPESTIILMCDLEEPVIKTLALEEGYIKFFHGACYSYRNRYRKFMKFSEEFFGYTNESDLSVRLLNRGFKILFYPSCKLYHKKTLTKMTKFQMFYMTRNNIWFWWRNAPLLHAVLGSFLSMIFDYSRASRSRVVPQYFKGVLRAFLGLPYCIRTREASKYLSIRDMQDLTRIKFIPIVKFLAK